MITTKRKILSEDFFWKCLLQTYLPLKFFKVFKYHTRLILHYYRHWVKNSLLKNSTFSLTRHWGWSRKKHSFSTRDRELRDIVTNWDPADWRASLLKSSWGHRGGSQAGHRPGECTHRKQTMHVSGGVWTPNCSKWQHLPLLGTGEARVEQWTQLCTTSLAQKLKITGEGTGGQRTHGLRGEDEGKSLV